MYSLENLTKEHFRSLSELVLGLWPDCDIKEEIEYWNEVLSSSDHYFALAKDDDKYIGFIDISIRTDHVEGSDSDKTPYLEVHHRIPLAKKGEDTVANAIALCPNCHRKSHYGD